MNTIIINSFIPLPCLEPLVSLCDDFSSAVALPIDPVVNSFEIRIEHAWTPGAARKRKRKKKKQKQKKKQKKQKKKKKNMKMMVKKKKKK
jgi:hypothetical protein